MTSVKLRDLSPSTQEFLEAVLAGLSGDPKTLPCKFLYDETGAVLFEAICTLDTYYPTRTEVSIMAQHAAEMARELGPKVRLIEPGSGSLTKIRFLLERLEDPIDFVPIDIALEQLEAEANVLAKEFPDLPVHPLCADFTQPFTLPACDRDGGRSVVYYPGSTLGNFEPAAAVGFLQRMAKLVGPGGALLVGQDLAKSEAVLREAYDDPAGVTAAFNKNLLQRMNRELGADFDVRSFRHEARFEQKPSRMVLQLVSNREQSVVIDDQRFDFAKDEAIVTEFSHKPTLDEFAELVASAGLRVERVWLDDDARFSVQLLVPA